MTAKDKTPTTEEVQKEFAERVGKMPQTNAGPEDDADTEGADRFCPLLKEKCRGQDCAWWYDAVESDVAQACAIFILAESLEAQTFDDEEDSDYEDAG